MTIADMSKQSRWAILDHGKLDKAKAHDVEFTCMKCMRDALLPVNGRVLAQLEEGLIFDTGEHHMPKIIRCPHCRSTLENA
jgi:hypothetical protein